MVLLVIWQSNFHHQIVNFVQIHLQLQVHYWLLNCPHPEIFNYLCQRSFILLTISRKSMHCNQICWSFIQVIIRSRRRCTHRHYLVPLCQLKKMILRKIELTRFDTITVGMFYAPFHNTSSHNQIKWKQPQIISL